MAKLVTKSCPKCRLGNRQKSEQLMADLPLHQTVPCPPFTHVSLDFLGPYLVRGLGNQRARIKVYGLVIVCQNVRAVKLYAVPGYDTYSFLLAYTRFVADHNAPALVVSDRGSQLVKAGGIIGNKIGDLNSWDWDAISAKAARSGTLWKFVEAGSQWRKFFKEFIILFQ